MPDDLVPIELKSLFRIASMGGGVLLDAGEKTFAMFIGAAEVRALALAAERLEPPRPLSHNLLDAILRRTGIEVLSLVIDALRDDTFHATLTLRRGGRELEIDCRPSDGLVMAIRHRAPIYVRREVLERVDDGEAVLRALQQRLRGLGAAPRPEPAPPPARSEPPEAEGPVGDVREVGGIDWSFLDELEAD
ncbi:MAG: bifunctional nuclease family protein [Planctomycetota bacterium]|nr:MAG: bifunctional nuclease family protein [Planctomycetota bacterium]